MPRKQCLSFVVGCTKCGPSSSCRSSGLQRRPFSLVEAFPFLRGTPAEKKPCFLPHPFLSFVPRTTVADRKVSFGFGTLRHLFSAKTRGGCYFISAYSSFGTMSFESFTIRVGTAHTQTSSISGQWGYRLSFGLTLVFALWFRVLLHSR